MLNTETKRHIDAARQVLVGKIPDPKSQIEQITNALIYKFMDDMDTRAVAQPKGKAQFFTGDLEKYAWTKLMDRRLGAQDRLNLYDEAIKKFGNAKQLPALFRTIFKQALLPFRDPNTLNLFLTEIHYFDYSHSEELGNAYEYLLSTLSTQGDAGQFRTPRHIIDFIVQIVDPKKTDTILDPACGTGGFLISAYKYILEKAEKEGKKLTPAERRAVMQNVTGYDISPDMVKLSLVNMYLHGFQTLNIFEYDTLSSLDHWDKKFNVMLANPPFMTPKGGIQPHNKFEIDANRAEVLFVDYIKTHLKPDDGRAGIIIPEGVIFQSGAAYKKLRKLLVEDGLWAVVSLPAGVFNPYSGVKTSILFFDNTITRQTKDILFLKIENDGYDLGAQRRKISDDDLPRAVSLLNAYKKNYKKTWKDESLAWLVKKEKVLASDDYGLTGERYKDVIKYTNQKYDLANLGDLCEIKTGKKDVNSGNANGQYPFFTCAKDYTYSDEYSFDTEAILVAGNGDVGAVKYYKGKFEAYQRVYVLSNFKDVDPKYLFSILNYSLKETVSKQKLGNTMPYIKLGMLTGFKIPVPPKEIQRKIVAEIENKQLIINSANDLIEKIEKEISNSESLFEQLNPEFVDLGQLCDLVTGGTPTSSKHEYYENGTIKWLVSGDIHKGEIYDCEGRITQLGMKNSNTKILPLNSVLIALNGQGKTRGTVALLKTEATCNQSLVAITPKDNKITSEYLYFYLKTIYQKLRNLTGEDQRSGLNMPILKKIKIPVVGKQDQKTLVEKFQKQQKAIESNQSIIDLFENQIKDLVKQIY